MNEIVASYGNYTIYKITHQATGGYYVCVPNNQLQNYQMFVGFANKDLSTLSKEEIIVEVNKVASFVNSLNNAGIYILPDIPISQLEQAVLANDERMFNNILVNRIQPITKQVYLLLNKRVNTSMINMIMQSGNDKKIVDWISNQYQNGKIQPIDYSMNLTMQRESEREKIVHVNNTMMHHQPVSQQTMNVPQPQQTTGITPINRQYDNEPTVNKENRLVRRLTMDNNNQVSSGFGSIKFIIATLILSLVVGVSIGYILIK